MNKQDIFTQTPAIPYEGDCPMFLARGSKLVALQFTGWRDGRPRPEKNRLYRRRPETRIHEYHQRSRSLEVPFRHQCQQLDS